jgi:hypothetical protein
MRKSRWTLAFFGFEAPSNQIAGVKGDAKEVGRDKAELRGADADDAYDRAIDGGASPALAEVLAQQRNSPPRVRGVLARYKPKKKSVEARSELAIEVHSEILVKDHRHITRAELHFAASPSGDGGKFEAESPLESSHYAIVNGNLTEPGARLS